MFIYWCEAIIEAKASVCGKNRIKKNSEQELSFMLSPWVSECAREWVKRNMSVHRFPNAKESASKWQKFQIKNKIGRKIDSKTSCLRKAFYVEFNIKSKGNDEGAKKIAAKSEMIEIEEN